MSPRGTPSISTVPLVGLVMPTIIFIVVVFPDPFCPINPKIIPFRTSSETESTTVSPLYFFEIFFIEIMRFFRCFISAPAWPMSARIRFNLAQFEGSGHISSSNIKMLVTVEFQVSRADARRDIHNAYVALINRMEPQFRQVAEFRPECFVKYLREMIFKAVAVFPAQRFIVVLKPH